MNLVLRSLAMEKSEKEVLYINNGPCHELSAKNLACYGKKVQP